MYQKKNFILFIFFLWCANILVSQTIDSTSHLLNTNTVSLKDSTSTNKAFEFNRDSLLFHSQPDTSLDSFHRLSFNIRQTASYPFYNYTERMGISGYGLKFTYSNYSLGLSGLLQPFTDMETYIPYKADYPYSHITFVSGVQNEQDIYVRYSSTIKDLVAIGIDCKRIGSDGFWGYDKSSLVDVMGWIGYSTKNSGYNVQLKSNLNKIYLQENGGRTEDTTGFFLPYLYAAENKLSKSGMMITQSILPQAWMSNLNLPGNNKVVINHHLITEKVQQTFEDDLGYDASYYSNIYNDSNLTFDSTHTSALKQKFFIEYYIKEAYLFEAGYKQEMFSYYQNTIRRKLNNHSAFMSGTFQKNNFYLYTIGNYTISGYSKGNYKICGAINKQYKDSNEVNRTTIHVSFNIFNERASYFLENFHSNHFSWQNSFDNITGQDISIGFNLNKLNLTSSLQLHNISNYIYFNPSAQPEQYEPGLQVASMDISKKITLFRHLNFDIKLLAQMSSSDFIRLPPLAAEIDLYYEDSLFKKAMHFMIGVHSYYALSYYGYAYMPATGIFYLQDDQLTGGYPFVDAYVSAKIKKVRLFLKMQHLNYGLMNGQYPYLVARHPIPGMILKWGVSWMFMN